MKGALSVRLFLAVLLSGAALCTMVPEVSFANDLRLRPRTRVSLLVAGHDSAHLADQLNHLEKLAELPDVLVGSVYVHGFGARLQQRRFRPAAFSSRDHSQSFSRLEAGMRSFGPQYRTLYDLELRSHKLELASQALSHLKPKYSPTWVIRHRGMDYVFEGLQNPSRLFSRNGRFLKAAVRY